MSRNIRTREEIIAHRAVCRRMTLEGVSATVIAAEIGVSLDTVKDDRRHMRDQGLLPRAGLRETGVPSWAECHAAGMTREQAVEARGSTRSAADSFSVRSGKRWPFTKAPTAKPKPFPRPSFQGLAPVEMIRDAQECNARMRARVFG